MDVETKNSVELQEALSIFGKMINIALIYGMQHPSVRAPLCETHLAFEAALQDVPQISIGLFHKTLTVNDKMVTEYTIHLRALERRLVSLEIPQLIISKGLTAKELGQLVDALCTANTQTGQTLKEKLGDAGLSYIKTEEVKYVAQHEGERLVGGDEGTGGGAEGGEEGDGDKDAKPAKPEATIHVEKIVAFLKGETASSEAPSADLEKLLSEPEKLGQLIMESAAVRQSVQSLDEGESLADIVIGCLRKTYEDLSQQKKNGSSNKKASLNKAMLLLEKTVVEKIRNAVGEDQPEIDEQVLSALREMEEERQVEILAARYAEQHKKFSKSELDLLQYVRDHGEEKAREILEEANVPEQEWRRLMVQARKNAPPPSGGRGAAGRGADGGADGGAGGGAGSGDAVDMGALAIVLDKLDSIMQFDETPSALVTSVIDEARGEVKAVAAQLENQVDELGEQVERCEAGEESTSRADLLLHLSQLSLKLAQPLTVINASVDAAILQVSNPEFQKELLDLAKESGLIMKGLLERLTKLVGYPSMQNADMRLSD